MKTTANVRRLTESAMMIAISTALALICALIPFLNFPFGGGITIASMLPIILISYRHGIRWGTFTAFVYSMIQMLMGHSTIAALFTDTPKPVTTLFYNSLVKTILILLIPYVMCYIYFIWQERVAQLRLIRERLAEDETALQAAYVQIYDEKGEMRLSVRREHLFLLESADNYVCVWYINNNSPKKVLVRNTLKHVAEQLASTHIQQCHRSYMVNLDLVKVMRREKEGMFIEFGIAGVPDVPISKTYVDSVKKWLMSSPENA